MKYAVVYIIVVNVFSFVLCGVDKRRAVKNLWRVSELALLLSAAVGGSVGLLLGMKAWHHKTRHAKFTLGVPAMLIAQIAAAIYFLPHLTNFLY